MFRALLAHYQEALHKPNLVCLRLYNVNWLWHECSETVTMPQPTDIIRTQYTKFRLYSAS
jgi:hypothetical protein